MGSLRITDHDWYSFQLYRVNIRAGETFERISHGKACETSAKIIVSSVEERWQKAHHPMRRLTFHSPTQRYFKSTQMRNDHYKIEV